MSQVSHLIQQRISSFHVIFGLSLWMLSIVGFGTEADIDGETDATFVLMATFSDDSSVFYCTANNITSDINITINSEFN